MIKKLIIVTFFMIITNTALAYAGEVKEIIINFDQKYFIDMKGMYRYTPVDEDMLEIKELPDGKMQVLPKRKGTTYLHVWNEQGRTTYKIVINRNIKKEYDWDSEDEAVKDNLQVLYNTRWGNGQGYSSYATNQFSYTWYLHQLKLSGKTPLGDMTTFLQVENRDASTDLVYANVFFNKNNKYFMSLGDTYVHLSNLTMNNLDFQGGLFKGTFFKKILFTLIGGSTGKKYWGGKVWNFPNDKTNFIGGHVDINVNKSLSLYAFGARGYNTNYTGAVVSQNYAVNNFGGGMQLRLWNPLKLTYEYAYDQTSKSHAHEATIDYYNKYSNFTYNFRSVPLNFGSISNLISFAGQEGYDIKTGIRILPYLTLDGSMRRYRYSVLQASNQPSNQKYSDNRIGIRFKKLGYPDVYVGRSTQERSFFDGDAFHTRTIFSLSHLFYKNNNLKAYIKYEPASYTKPSLPTQNFTNKRVLIGGEFNIFKKLKFVVEEDIQRKNYYNTATPTSTIMGFNVLAYLDEINIPKTPLYFSSSFKYQHESDLSLNVPESVSFWQEYTLAARFKKPDKGIDEGKIYFKYSRRGLAGRNILQIDRDVCNYEYGAVINFNSNISLISPKAYLKGIVYYDKNGNGIKDTEEKYMQQISIKTSKGTETISNNQGFFTMVVKPGEYSVFVDSSQIPKGFIASFRNPDKFNINSGEHKELNLAVISDTGLRGFVFLDSNKNGYRDEGEEMISDLTLLIEGQSIKVDQNGEFFMSFLDPGYYKISYYDINELKSKYITKKYQYQVRVNKGKYSTIAIPLIAK